MRLAIYTITVKCPNDWTDDDWSDNEQDKLDAIVHSAGEALQLKVTEELNKPLLVELTD